MILGLFLVQEMGQFRHRRLKSLNQYTTGQPAEGEDQVGEPMSEMFLHMRGMSRHVGPVKKCWNGMRPLRVADVIMVKANVIQFCSFMSDILMMRNYYWMDWSPVHFIWTIGFTS